MGCIISLGQEVRISHYHVSEDDKAYLLLKQKKNINGKKVPLTKTHHPQQPS